ncbi:MAG: hypothetical protein C0624_11945 [Desulfuromonas sp.]|nr:MAG: hypothetical protein C0624_11945 [Desulfuromonas sp.]
MNWNFRIVFLGLVLAILLVLSGCSSPEEKAAKAQLEQALALEQQSDLPAARELLGKLAKKYPQTKAAADALVAEQRIVKQMTTIWGELDETLESMVLVIAGYQSMSGMPLTRIEELDGGDYMFDSSYLAEAIPAGVEAFVRLDGQSGFQLWVYRASTHMGMTRDHLMRHGKPVSSEAVIAKLRSDYTAQQVAARLTELKPLVSAQK